MKSRQKIKLGKYPSFLYGEGPTIPKSEFYFTISVTIEMVLYRSMQI